MFTASRSKQQRINLSCISAGLIHYMKNNNCTTPLKMVTVFNNVDSGELILLEKILAFNTATALVSTGLDEVSF